MTSPSDASFAINRATYRAWAKIPLAIIDVRSVDSMDHMGEITRTLPDDKTSSGVPGLRRWEGMIWVPGSQEYLDHLKEQNVCKTCQTHFESTSNLKNHQMVHLERSIECHGCYRISKNYPAMIIHLESSACDSEIDVIDLNESAATCFR
ncbi:hypothetical protein WAI453_006457 [Rhynchosporium graminicola]